MGIHQEAMLGFARTLGAGAICREFETLEIAMVYNSGTLVIIGHSGGYAIGLTDARHVAELLLDFVGTASLHQIFLCACNTGEGTFAQELKNRLGGIVEIWAPKTTVHSWATGANGAYAIIPTGGDVTSFTRIA